ncbi:MAG: hypothetical protein Q9216_000451 [Gyalolechia sp. 2 TL-2023]
MASSSSFDTHLADQKVKTLVNAQLKVILKREKLAVSGLKAAMQNRIIGPKPIFKDSPFYTVLKPLTAVQECKVREATRDQAECKITLESDVTDKLTTDPSLRVMVFCASEPISHFSKVDIAFPHQVELKVNMDEVKANLRGLKNRPGSTRPADITTLLRKRANYENSLSLTYALTHKKFYFVVNLVKQNSVEELVSKLKSGKSISREQVIRESTSMIYFKQPQDGDPSSCRSHDSSEDEELVEIKDPPRITAVKQEINNGASFMRTPPASSREQSSSSVPPLSAGAKRPLGAVIDLTNDEDDEDGQRSSKNPTIPAYPAKVNYSPSGNIDLSSRTGISTPYTTDPLSKPNHFHGGYPRPP